MAEGVPGTCPSQVWLFLPKRRPSQRASAFDPALRPLSHGGGSRRGAVLTPSSVPAKLASNREPFRSERILIPLWWLSTSWGLTLIHTH